MTYVCKWEYQNGKVESIYTALQKEIVDLWSKPK